MSWAAWITGRSTADTSRIAQVAAERLRAAGDDVAVLELDALRRCLTPAPTGSDEEREALQRALVYIAACLVEAGRPVIVDATEPAPIWRDLARATIPRFVALDVAGAPTVDAAADTVVDVIGRRPPRRRWTPDAAALGRRLLPDKGSEEERAIARRARAWVAREAMVREQIAGRGVRDAAVLAAMRAVPREEFVDRDLAPEAYEDAPLPIGEGQTISQPYIVAVMTEALRLAPRDRVLEIGTGSGYAAAVLARIAGDVYTVERIESLAEMARRRLAALGYGNVHVRHGDGSLGWPEHAPYDAIVVTAGGPHVPPPLLQQLALGGRLVMPVGASHCQRLVRVVQRAPDVYDRQALEEVCFVPLVGAEGWPAVEGGC
ncbi:MAG TPA: protein-L-isoaspartate(D-aspartate) O-methyltransferase [Methylomirabilota bacterium]|nr:protein-L-isoaspartate(D-aspartate) O-methyltransferase [Methylomirabilota bacterium]